MSSARPTSWLGIVACFELRRDSMGEGASCHVRLMDASRSIFFMFNLQNRITVVARVKFYTCYESYTLHLCRTSDINGNKAYGGFADDGDLSKLTATQRRKAEIEAQTNILKAQRDLEMVCARRMCTKVKVIRRGEMDVDGSYLCFIIRPRRLSWRCGKTGMSRPAAAAVLRLQRRRRHNRLWRTTMMTSTRSCWPG